MKNKLVLVGGGGHCKSCIEVIESQGNFEIIGILDKNIGEKVLGYEIIGNDDKIPELVKANCYFLITVGFIKSASTRISLFNRIESLGGKFAKIIASTAFVSKYATIGDGSIIMHHSFVNAEAKIGKNSIINTGAIIEHECEIGDNCHISTNVIVNGQVKIGAECFIGSGSVFYNNITIQPKTNIGATSLLHKTLLLPGTYLGQPLTRIR